MENSSIAATEDERSSNLPTPMEGVEDNHDGTGMSSDKAEQDVNEGSICKSKSQEQAFSAGEELPLHEDTPESLSKCQSGDSGNDAVVSLDQIKQTDHQSGIHTKEVTSSTGEKPPRGESAQTGRGGCHDNSDDEAGRGAAEEERKDEEDDDATARLYQYTRAGEFTSEIYKILLQNLPKHFGYKQLRKMLENLNLKPKKIKGSGKSSSYAFVTFGCEDDRQQALQVLCSHKWKGRQLKAKIAKPVIDPVLALKRKQERQSDGRSDKRTKTDDDDLPIEERLNNVVTPLWKMDYQEQLQLKQKVKEEFLVRFGKSLQHDVPMLSQWLKEQRKANNGLCCQLEQIKPSPVINGYRTKCEFSVGTDPNGEGKTVGFRLGLYKGGQLSVVNPASCNNVPDKSKAVLQSFQTYIRESDITGYDPVTHQGHWRMLTVRTTQGSGIMAMVTFHRQALSDEGVEQEKQSLVTYFRDGDGKSCGVTSLYIHIQRLGDNHAIEYEHIYGEKHITEDLLELKFRISPEAFFQVNTKAAEVLYTTVAEWAQVSKGTTLLDICCGTGTIGLSLAKNVEKVIGIELNQQAVDDAKVNAEINGMTNITFRCGKAEDLLPDITNRLHNSLDVVGIVDPPRAGLHPRVLQAIRRCPHLNRLIYVSCDASQALQNFLDLCRPISKKRKGIPFRPIKAIPVDLFPHANHCELIILFERMPTSGSGSGASGSTT